MVYFAYGWPRVLEASVSIDKDEQVIYLSFTGDTCIVVFRKSIQLWSTGQHSLKIADFTREESSLERDGLNCNALWCPSKQVLAVATISGNMFFYGTRPTRDVLWTLNSGIELAAISMYLQNEVSVSESTFSLVDIVGDPHSLALVAADGTCQVYSWKAVFKAEINPFILHMKEEIKRLRRRSISLNDIPRPSSSLHSQNSLAAGADASMLRPKIEVIKAHYSSSTSILACILADGRCALCQTLEGSQTALETLKFMCWLWTPLGEGFSSAVSIEEKSGMLALGLTDGKVALYNLSTVQKMGRYAGTPLSRAGSSVFTVDGQPSTPTTPIRTHEMSNIEPLRILSISDWGYSSGVVGAAALLEWSPDGRVLAVGYSKRGIAVWTPTGCRVMTTLPQQATGDQQNFIHTQTAEEKEDGLPIEMPSLPDESSSLLPRRDPPQSSEILQGGGIHGLAWSCHGYTLLVAESSAPQSLVEIAFVKSALGQGHHHTTAQMGATSSMQSTAMGMLLGPDRIVLITSTPPMANPALFIEGKTPSTTTTTGQTCSDERDVTRSSLSLQHIRAPPQYLETNYPLTIAAVNPYNRQDIGVAGTKGAAIYSHRSKHWRLFGDACQEKEIRTHFLAWLPNSLLAIVATLGTGSSRSNGSNSNSYSKGAIGPHILVYPKWHLDQASLLTRYKLLRDQVPTAVEASGDYMLLSYSCFQVQLLHVAQQQKPQMSTAAAAMPQTNKEAMVCITAVREISVMGLLSGRVKDIALIPPQTSAGAAVSSIRGGSSSSSNNSSSSSSSRGATTSSSLMPSSPRQDGEATLQPSTDESGLGNLAGGLKIKVPKASSAALSVSVTVNDAARIDPHQPTKCLVLRHNGISTLLDLNDGSEELLSSDVESFWLPPSASQALNPMRTTDDDGLPESTSFASQTALGYDYYEVSTPQREDAQMKSASPAIELPWWTYGSQGMQLWFPMSLEEPITPSAQRQQHASLLHHTRACLKSTDPELEFDKEVYPVVIAMADVSILGVTQRLARRGPIPAFYPVLESQPVLPCLLRRLLQQGRSKDALKLAQSHAHGAYFSHSLEWLLFTCLELDCAGNGKFKDGISSKLPSNSYSANVSALEAAASNFQQYSTGMSSMQREDTAAGPLLRAAAAIIHHFPQYPQITVSVARKTDAELWPPLFAAMGAPSEICERLYKTADLRNAACCLLIVDQVEGVERSQELGLALLHAAMLSTSYELMVDVLRFLAPPSENLTSLHDNQSEVDQSLLSKVWGYFTGVDKVEEDGGEKNHLPNWLAGTKGGAGHRAWLSICRHAWKLVDAGSFRLLALLGVALAPLASQGGGLEHVLLGLPREELKAMEPHFTLTAAGIASALFVATNELAGVGEDGTLTHAAQNLLSAFDRVGLVNQHAALAILLGEEETSQAVHEQHPQIWRDLQDLILNDVHLCGYSMVVSPATSPMIVRTCSTLQQQK